MSRCGDISRPFTGSKIKKAKISSFPIVHNPYQNVVPSVRNSTHFTSGIKLSGTVTLSSYTEPNLPAGSCLTIYIQEALTCSTAAGTDGGNNNSIDCRIPIAANQTFNNVQLVNGTAVPYQMVLPSLRKTMYTISAVLNIGWCRVNSLKTHQLLHEGDYHTTYSDQFTVSNTTVAVQKDLDTEIVTLSDIGMSFCS